MLFRSYSQPYRWKEDHWCNVLTGAALSHTIHPTEPRLITHREAARIQGLPDDWNIENSRDYSALEATWGKAVPVQAARWVSRGLKDSLYSNYQETDAEVIGDREYLVNDDDGFSRVGVKRKWYAGVK